MPVRAVFFDLYGTLIDIWTNEDDPGVYETLSHYLAYLGILTTPEALRTDYKARVQAALDRRPSAHHEVDVYRIFFDLLGTGTARGGGVLSRGRPSDPASMALATAVLYRALTRRRFEVFPGVYEVLDTLRTVYRLGLISDAQWVFAEPELEMTGLSRFFQAIVLSSRIGVKKPSPAIFTEALRRLGVPAEESVYIGDSPDRDLVGARAAGMRCILFRAVPADQNTPLADARFDDYAMLPGILREFSGVHSSPRSAETLP